MIIQFPQKIQDAGLTLVRLFTGFFMIYHGAEIFDPGKMNDYLQWDMFRNGSTGKLMVYAGKGAEFVGGIFLFAGFLTRAASLLLAGTMAYITFFVAEGRIWYEDQHPFLFVLLGLVFFFYGGDPYSLDHFIFKNKR